MLNDIIFNSDSRPDWMPADVREAQSRGSEADKPSLLKRILSVPTRNHSLATQPSQNRDLRQTAVGAGLNRQPLTGLSAINGCRNNDVVIDFSRMNEFMKRSAVVYQSPGDIRQQFPETRCIADIGDKGLRYLLESNSVTGEDIITIRGTDNLKNRIQDLDYFYTYNPDLEIYAHRGFNDDANVILGYLLRNHLLSKEKPIVVTGHSLGGAIANLILLNLHHQGYKKVSCISFGQPKVTNAAGVKKYEAVDLQRVVSGNDLVPFLPPNSLQTLFRGPFEHLGSEVVLLDDQYYSYLEEHDASRKSVSGFSRNILRENWEDHHIDRYLNSINNKLLLSERVPYDKREEHIHMARLGRVCPCLDQSER